MELAIGLACNSCVQACDLGSQARYIQINGTTGRHVAFPFGEVFGGGSSGPSLRVNTSGPIAGGKGKSERRVPALIRSGISSQTFLP
jgi:hypothetical protein